MANTSKQEYVDPWHFTGNEQLNSWKEGEEFIKLCCEKLPVDEIPIVVGSTGYIDLTGEISIPKYCRCLDSFVRNVFVIGDVLVCQRYVNGHSLMHGKIKDGYFNQIVTEEHLKKWVEDINHNI